MKTFLPGLRIATLVALAVLFTAVGMAIGASLRDRIHWNALATPGSGAGMIDVGFAQHMAWHHDQAVVMTHIVEGRASPHIGLLARGIAADQLLEIGELKGWLKMWGASVLPTSISMDWIFKNRSAKWSVSPAYLELCRSTAGNVPGMASIDELNHLRGETGERLDVLFLQLMVRHHMSALPMARYAAENAQTPLIRSAAAKMIFDQRREIMAMRTLLKQSGAQPLPFPDVDDV